MTTILGQGSYGKVIVRDGNAVKKFCKLSHLIQEYMALKYLKDCSYVVHAKGVNFHHLELYMELYDCSLRKWLENQMEKDGANEGDIMKILRDVLRGLVELHDRDLAHGDLKPGNILIKRNPLRAVLGDCGFVSIAKYAKVDRTTTVYRDPVISYDYTHDMFSFGICFLEMIGNIKIHRQATYVELKQLIQDKVYNVEHRKIIHNLLHSDKDRRPSARTLLYRLFKEDPPVWSRPNFILPSSYSDSEDNVNVGLRTHQRKFASTISSVVNEDREYIRVFMKRTAYEFKINRGKKGYGALLSYIDNHKIELSMYRVYTCVTLMILSSIFGRSGFRQDEVIKLCDHGCNEAYIYNILEKILSDHIFVNILLTPDSDKKK